MWTLTFDSPTCHQIKIESSESLDRCGKILELKKLGRSGGSTLNRNITDYPKDKYIYETVLALSNNRISLCAQEVTDQADLTSVHKDSTLEHAEETLANCSLTDLASLLDYLLRVTPPSIDMRNYTQDQEDILLSQEENALVDRAITALSGLIWQIAQQSRFKLSNLSSCT
ncbi:unnamed protein product [Protopolystoma xenopodis]|uniref:Uncharacterized protein n=1 Tax=Protopolystoma xenopodis TaxID=117903 RepID=A0A448X5J4_9PLAT|nr:unnamed protein product [Protopolystoma xenopodis]